MKSPDNILEASTGVFYIKIMRFAGFLHVQIHGISWNAKWIYKSYNVNNYA